ncbi:MAG: PLP-dependent aminotransferase family protein [Mycetocola reblochoni]|uniref:Transcriptional regulator, GntR family domain / Aspartate aminotransferase n=2 Tax=Mycetocola reblochoni TaxID=331618 RepID=A0A1R4ITC2_9MICO|nr:aminotransferase class I/II-fold pyridoxal phosphate-dependent enzyme [Mycetocola reblochoni]SJN23110.1 Transcriptional regulator, GntR family domain / Aspartate aminotransferase [Mycetocola reblochoni REB411]
MPLDRIARAIDDTSPTGIAAAISRLITGGEIAPGERLPTVRELASRIGVSPATVSHAWQALSGVGLITSRGRSGSFVHDRAPSWQPRRYAELSGHTQTTRIDLSRGTPDPALLPSIGRALSRVAERAGTASYHDTAVMPALRETLESEWPSGRGSLTVVDGALDALSRTLDVVVRFGDRVVVEDPTFPPFIDLLELAGAQIVAVPLDGEGISVTGLAHALSAEPSAVLLQPRAHNPSGVSMTAARAEAVAHTIRRAGSDVVVIEDDHHGALSAAPAFTFARLLPEQTVTIRSFSKSHGPDLRIAALGGPSAIVDRIAARRTLGPAWTSHMVQSILNELLHDPVAVAEVRLAADSYRTRQRLLADALAGQGLAVPVRDGVNTVFAVPDERDAAVQLAASGVRVATGSAFAATATPRAPFVRVTAGQLRSAEDAEHVATALAGLGLVPTPWDDAVRG